MIYFSYIIKFICLILWNVFLKGILDQKGFSFVLFVWLYKHVTWHDTTRHDMPLHSIHPSTFFSFFHEDGSQDFAWPGFGFATMFSFVVGDSWVDVGIQQHNIAIDFFWQLHAYKPPQLSQRKAVIFRQDVPHAQFDLIIQVWGVLFLFGLLVLLLFLLMFLLLFLSFFVLLVLLVLVVLVVIVLCLVLLFVRAHSQTTCEGSEIKTWVETHQTSCTSSQVQHEWCKHATASETASRAIFHVISSCGVHGTNFHGLWSTCSSQWYLCPHPWCRQALRREACSLLQVQNPKGKRETVSQCWVAKAPGHPQTSDLMASKAQTRQGFVFFFLVSLMLLLIRLGATIAQWRFHLGNLCQAPDPRQRAICHVCAWQSRSPWEHKPSQE